MSTINAPDTVRPFLFHLRSMFMPHLLANFIYRQPRASSLSVWAKDVLFNFVSRDLHCAAALCRRFYWSDVNLWPQVRVVGRRAGASGSAGLVG